MIATEPKCGRGISPSPTPGTEEITLLTEQSNLGTIAGIAGLLFECAPDSPLRQTADACVSIEQLLGNQAQAKAPAAALARRLLSGEPAIRGVRQLGVFEEVVIRQLVLIFQLFRLHEALCSMGVRRVRFREHSIWAEGLTRIRALAGGDYSVGYPVRRPAEVQSKLKAHFAEFGFGPSAFSGLAKRASRRMFPLLSRLLSGLSATRPRAPRGSLWLYSTAYTFTKIGLAYEPFLPEPLHYLVENPDTGGRALAESGRRAHQLYAYASPSDRPSRHEIRGAASMIQAHLEAVPLSGTDCIARELFLQSPGFRDDFCRRQLPLGLLQTSTLRRWLEDTQPSVLLVGNPAFEGYALQQAPKLGIPTVLLQHGVLGDYYQYMDQPADHILVRGPFFQEFLSEAARRKARILNFPQERPSAPRHAAGRDLLFLTAPYGTTRFFHSADLDDILAVLVHAATAADRTLVVRVHPVESVDYYQRRLDRVCREHGVPPAIRYSQGGELDAVLKCCGAAVLFSSTAFLDCIRLGIPIISFGWHDFSFRSLLARHGVFHFANDLADLHRLVLAALRGKLGAAEGLEKFSAPCAPAEVQEFFRALLPRMKPEGQTVT